MTDLTLLKFEADWCGPCDQQSSLLEGFERVPIETIDVDENTERANDYNVRSLPTLVLEVDGEPVERWSGVTTVEEIEDAIDTHE